MGLLVSKDKGILGKGDAADLWREIISHIPETVLENKNSKFLFPCIGNATEVKVLARKLKTLNWTDQEIHNAFYLCDKYYTFTNPARKQGFTNVHTGDFLEWKLDMKFDVVIGNPPYQHESNKSLKIWVDFSVKALSLTHESGIVAFITPLTWMRKPIGRTFGKITDVFNRYQLMQVNTNVNHHFDIGEKVCYWILKNTTKYQKTAFIINDKTLDIDYNRLPIALNDHHIIFDNVVSKLITNYQGTFIRNIYHSDFNYSTKDAIGKGIISETQTAQYCVPVFVTASQQDKYTTKDRVKKCLKLILNCSGYYAVQDQLDKYMPISDTLAVGEAGIGIEFNTKKEAANARTFLSSRLYRFYVDNEKTGGFNTGILNLPILDFTRTWTDEELYDHFNLTQEERDYIEANVKD